MLVNGEAFRLNLELRAGTYKLWCRPLVDVLSGVPFLIPRAVVVDCALEIMDWEEQFLCAPLVESAEYSVMAHQRLKLATEGMSLDPILG